jgi:hypothetical protein
VTIYEEFRVLLNDLNRKAIDIDSFLDRFNELNRHNLYADLGPELRTLVVEFQTWYADMYDAHRPPRAGVVGMLRDRWEALGGNYRISREQLEAAARVLEERVAKVPTPQDRA